MAGTQAPIRLIVPSHQVGPEGSVASVLIYRNCGVNGSLVPQPQIGADGRRDGIGCTPPFWKGKLAGRTGEDLWL